MEYRDRKHRFRLKLKENPEELKKYLEKERERARRYRMIKKATMDEYAKAEQRRKERERQRKYRAKRKKLFANKDSAPIMLTNISETIKSHVENNDLEDHERFKLIELINTLNATERSLIASNFCKLPWNIGSLRVLGLLQELRILTATEYILSLENDEEIQLLLNVFLDSEYDLISNLFISFALETPNYIRINAILNKCLENLFKDLLLNSAFNDLQFLNYIKNNIPAGVVLKITHKILNVVLSLHHSNIKEAFCKFSSWINEGVDELKFPQDLYNQLLCKYPEESLNYLLKCSTIENFKEWKFYLIMLQTISHCNIDISGPYMRKYLKSRLKQCATLIPCKRNFMHLLLTARAATAVTMDITINLNNYADWYKNNIGEMKYLFRPEEFQNVIAMLEECIDYEMEIDYLEIHSLIAISAPVLCGKLVQTYKLKCKQRLQQIKKGNLQDDASVSIIIEDSN